MKEGPDVSIVAALIGDPARANMLMALMSGLALSGTELAAEAGVTLSTASGHLSKLERAGLVATSKQGRTCIDWSERRRHLGGGLGAAILDHVLERRWAVREGRSRVVRFSPRGEPSFVLWYSGA